MLSDTDKAILETMRMRLSTAHALQYLKDNEFPLSRASYFRHKKKLEEKKLKRLYEIAKIGFQDQHLETIDQYEMGFKMMWENVLREQDPYKQNSMINDILLLKPYLSAYYEATKLIIDKQQFEYQEFLDKQEQQQIKQEKITKSRQQQQNDEDSINDDDEEEEVYNSSNAQF